MTSPPWVIGFLYGARDETARTLSDALALISMFGFSYAAAQYCLLLLRHALAARHDTVVQLYSDTFSYLSCSIHRSQ